MVNVKEVKSNKDIVKFGYTEKMISLIQDKTGFKVKMQWLFRSFDIFTVFNWNSCILPKLDQIVKFDIFWI